LGLMDKQTHWDKIYAQKAPDRVSWYSPRLEASLAPIEQAGAGQSASIINVGAGESTLVDDLLARGYSRLTVLDISQAAIAASGMRPGDAAERDRWLVADITRAEPERGFSFSRRCSEAASRLMSVSDCAQFRPL
jgi:hypothetical protein